MSKLPEFLIIGTQKGGTTSLYNYLTNYHPKILPANVKSLDFFTFKWNSDSNDEERLKQYCELFPERDVDKGEISGEASATNCFPSALRRIMNLFRLKNQKPKIIFLMRDPVERAFSHFNFLKHLDEVKGRSGEEWQKYLHDNDSDNFEHVVDRQLSFLKEFDAINDSLKLFEKKMDESIALNGDFTRFALFDSHLFRSIYWPVIELLQELQLFDNQTLILESKDLKNDTASVVKRVVEFLEVDVDLLTLPEKQDDIPLHMRTKEKLEMSIECKEKLKKFFEPHDKRLSLLLKRKLSWQK